MGGQAHNQLNNNGNHILVITTLHEITFMTHLIVVRIVSKTQNSLYWKGMVRDIKEFVETYLVYKLGKSGHTPGKGQLHSSSIQKVKWQEFNLDLSTCLHRTQTREACILIVIDKSTCMVYLIPLGQTIEAIKIIELFQMHIRKSHSIPHSIYSDKRGTILQ